MKKITFLLILLFAISLTAQAQPEVAEEAAEATTEEATTEDATTTEEATTEEATQPKTVEEIEEEAVAPAEETEPEPEKVTMTKEEIQAIVQEMVKEELAKRDAEKNIVEIKPKAEEKKPEEKKNLRPRDGLLAPSYSKSSVTFIIGDDNLRNNDQYSPKFDIGQRYEYEDFAERVYGYSNTAKSATRFSLFHEEAGFIKNLTARMALSFKMYNQMDSLNDSVETKIREDKSFVELDYRHPSTNRFKVTFYPYNSDSIAIGNFRGLKWGGNSSVWPQGDGSPIPGFQALYGYGDLSVYFGFKAHAQSKTDKLDGKNLAPVETVYGFFGGASYNNKDLGIKAHLQGAIIDKGDNVNITETVLADPKDDSIISYGIDAFAQYNFGSEFGDPIGINSFTDGSWLAPDYTSRLAFRVSAEYLFQDERLENADYMSIQNQGNITPITDNFMAHGAMMELGLRYRWIRAMFSYSYRDLPFMVFDAPGVNPYQTISKEAEQTPEHLITISSDFHIWDMWFGISYGYKIPATYSIKDENGQKTVMVIKERLSSDAVSTAFDRTREVLPPGRDPLDMMFVKANIKYQFSDSVTALLEYSFTQDHNRPKMLEQDSGNLVTEWDDKNSTDIHGLMFLVEGRF